MTAISVEELLTDAVRENQSDGTLAFLARRLVNATSNSVVGAAPVPQPFTPPAVVKSEDGQSASIQEVWDAAADYLRTRRINARVCFQQIATALERSSISSRLDQGHSGDSARNPVLWRKQLSQYLASLRARGILRKTSRKGHYLLLQHPPEGDQWRLLERIELAHPFTPNTSIRRQVDELLRAQLIGVSLAFSDFKAAVVADPGTVLDCNVQPSEYRPAWLKVVQSHLRWLVKAGYLKPSVPPGSTHRRLNRYVVVKHP